MYTHCKLFDFTVSSCVSNMLISKYVSNLLFLAFVHFWTAYITIFVVPLRNK